jgi:hypothetical protein
MALPSMESIDLSLVPAAARGRLVPERRGGPVC